MTKQCQSKRIYEVVIIHRSDTIICYMASMAKRSHFAMPHPPKYGRQDHTRQREEGKDSQGGDAKLSKCKVHFDDVHQDLLRDVRSPKHHKAQLGTYKTDHHKPCYRETLSIGTGRV